MKAKYKLSLLELLLASHGLLERKSKHSGGKIKKKNWKKLRKQHNKKAKETRLMNLRRKNGKKNWKR